MSRTILIGRPRLFLAPLALEGSWCPVEEPAHPTQEVGVTAALLRGLGERVAASLVD